MSDRKDGLVSYHLIGVHLNNDVFIQPLNDSVPARLGMWDILAFERLCTGAGTRPVGTIRCRQEGDKVQPHRSYFSDAPNEQDICAMNNALLRVMADRSGHLDPNRPYAALIEDFKKAEELGINIGVHEEKIDA
jgi:hypothetical protein